jgi:hypothetical protein
MSQWAEDLLTDIHNTANVTESTTTNYEEELSEFTSSELKQIKKGLRVIEALVNKELTKRNS